MPTGLLEPVSQAKREIFYLASIKEQFYKIRKFLECLHRHYVAKMRSYDRECEECVNHTGL